MIDPVLGGVVAILVVAALIFSYFARQGDSDQYDKLAKSRLVEKKLVPKAKPQKNKKEKKTMEKREQPSLPIKTSSVKPVIVEKRSAAPNKAVDQESQIIPQDPVSIDKKQKLKQPQPVTPPVVQEKLAAKESEVIMKDLEMTVAPVVDPVQSVQPEVTLTNVQAVPQIIEKTSQKPMSKRKKKVAVVPWDLDEQKLLSYLSNVNEVEPDCISYLAQYFTDSNEKMTGFRLTIANLEKMISDLRLKAEQHCVARMSAEKDSQKHQHHLVEMGKKIDLLDKELHNTKATMEELKKSACDSNSLALTNAELKTEVEQLRQSEQSTQHQCHALQQQVKEWEVKTDATIKEIESLRSVLDANRKAQVGQNEMHAELIGREATISLLRSEFTELELLTRDHIYQKHNIDKAVLTDSLFVVEEQVKEKTLEMQTKESEWKTKEVALVSEKNHLRHIVENLQKEIQSFEQIKKENVLLQQHITQKEAQLEQAKKISMELEDTLATEESLKLENEGLKADLVALRCEMTTLALFHQEELNLLRATFARFEEENSALKKIHEELITISPSTQQPALISVTEIPPEHMEMVKALRVENQQLLDKNQELRSRNHTVMSYVYDLEEKLKTGNAAPSETTKDIDAKTLVDDQPAAVLPTVFSQPAPKVIGDSGCFDETLKDLATNLEKIENVWRDRVDKCETMTTKFKKRITRKD